MGSLDCRRSVSLSEDKTVTGSIATNRFAAAVAVWATILLLTIDKLGADITGLVAAPRSCAETVFGDSAVRPLLADLRHRPTSAFLPEVTASTNQNR